jgi:hypothetical protein
VTHSIDPNDPVRISNFVDHAVIADANPPIILASYEFPTAVRPRVPRKARRLRERFGHGRFRQPAKILFSPAFKKDLKHALFALPDIRLAGDNEAVSSASFFNHATSSASSARSISSSYCLMGKITDTGFPLRVMISGSALADLIQAPYQIEAFA